MRWTLVCHVVDNLGDVGVCWRLALSLAARGDAVQLVLDDARALAWMAPGGAAGVEVVDWDAAARAVTDDPGRLGDVVVEAFGCRLPSAIEAAIGRRTPAPVWINLEYLGVERRVERLHGLPSPQPGGLPTKWFFFPGFDAGTGGLLREPGLLETRARFDADAWLEARGWPRRAGERAVSLFCYPGPSAPRLPALLAALALSPTLLLATVDAVQAMRAAGRGAAIDAAASAPVRIVALPWLTQPEYDRLLWACDMNFVRGEDSLVRAIWAGSPFVWQAYPQDDGAHAAKLEAVLTRLRPPAAAAVLWRAWNGLDATLRAGDRAGTGVAPDNLDGPEAPMSSVRGAAGDDEGNEGTEGDEGDGRRNRAHAAAFDTATVAAWRAASGAWRDELAARPGLAEALRAFALAKARVLTG